MRPREVPGDLDGSLAAGIWANKPNTFITMHIALDRGTTQIQPGDLDERN